MRSIESLGAAWERRAPAPATRCAADGWKPSGAEQMGLRDRAILETLYSTGIRRMEVVNLTVYDLDMERGTLMVRQGKGKKDRMVPIGERAVAWLERYLNDTRPGLVVPPDDATFFLTSSGEPLSPSRLTQLVREYVDAAEIGKRGACHLFRHTMATLMLENGADIRYIQEMLGHAELSTTQIYTRVSIRRLKTVHALTHPGATLARGKANAAAVPPLAKTDGADELFSRLAAEDDEETAERDSTRVTA